MTRAPLSLTARLTLLYTTVSFSVLACMSALVVYATHRNFVQQDVAFLEEKYRVVVGVAEAREHTDISRLLKALELSHHGLYTQLWQGGNLVYGAPGLSAPSQQTTSGDTPLQWQATGMRLRGIRLPLELTLDDAGAPAHYELLVAVDTTRKTVFLQRLSQALALFVLLATAASGLLAWLAARAGLRPLRVMRERAAQVSAQQLEPRMPVEAVPAEMSGLAESLNHMLSRLKADFERLQQLSGDLAHELRTPINTLLTQSQVVLAHPRSNDEYAEALTANIEELQRFARTIADILFLAHTDSAGALPQIDTLDLQHEVQQLCEFYDALADAKGMSFTLQGPTPVQVQGDRLMLRRAISNLIANALRYGTPATSITIAAAQTGQRATLTITNTGDTIAPEHLPRLFDRFYRVDRARQRPDSEGAGLGLAICQAIVHAHGGHIRVQSQAGATRFVIDIPTAQTQPPSA